MNDYADAYRLEAKRIDAQIAEANAAGAAALAANHENAKMVRFLSRIVMVLVIALVLREEVVQQITGAVDHLDLWLGTAWPAWMARPGWWAGITVVAVFGWFALDWIMKDKGEGIV